MSNREVFPEFNGKIHVTDEPTAVRIAELQDNVEILALELGRAHAHIAKLEGLLERVVEARWLGGPGSTPRERALLADIRAVLEATGAEGGEG